MNNIIKSLNLLSLILLILAAQAISVTAKEDQAAENFILKAMRDEMNRSMENLKLDDLRAPYYMEYQLRIIESTDIKANLGSIVDKNNDKIAQLDVEVRVGDYKFDNTNFFDFGLSLFGSSDDEERFKNRNIPYELDYNILRRELWLATDAAYKQVAEIFAKKEATLKNKMRKDTTHDFLYIKPEKTYLAEEIPSITRDYENLLKKISGTFAKYPEIFVSGAGFEYIPETIYYVNSEGREYIKTELFTGFELSAVTQAEDGMPLTDFYTAYSENPNALPADDSLFRAAEIMAEKLKSKRNALIEEESYSGPVIFSGQASAELFAQVFAPNLVAQRDPLTENGVQKDERYNAFQTKIGGRVLPEFLSVKAIPSREKYGDTPLTGHNIIDDDGVKSKDLTLVQDGYLKTLLSSRVPTKRVRESNGHNIGKSAMMSSLQIECGNEEYKKTPSELENRMLKLCKDRELPYGIVITKLLNLNVAYTSIFRMTNGDFPVPRGNTENYIVEAYRVYPDGKRELLRGLRTKGLNVQSFKDIIAAGNSDYVLNYLAPAVTSPFVSGGSQYLPVSIIIPDLLFEDAEIKPSDEDFPKPPIMQNPVSIK